MILIEYENKKKGRETEAEAEAEAERGLEGGTCSLVGAQEIKMA